MFKTREKQRIAKRWALLMLIVMMVSLLSIPLGANDTGAETAYAALQARANGAKDEDILDLVENAEEKDFSYILCGDVNHDRYIDDRDSILLARYLANWDVVSLIHLEAADIDGNTEVEDMDAISFARSLARWNVETKIGSLSHVKPLSILFVGNSFTYSGNVPYQVSALAKLYGLKIKYQSICPGGASLSSTKELSIQAMRENKFDYVVFQDYGGRPLNKEFHTDVKMLCDEARENGASPILYNPAFANIDGKPDKDYQEVLTAGYERAAKENDAVLVNAADAWVYAYLKLSDISLYIENDFHANTFGAYLTSCVFVSTLFDLHVKDAPDYLLRYPDSVTSLGQAAWEFVSYYKQNGKSPEKIVTTDPGANIKSIVN